VEKTSAKVNAGHISGDVIDELSVGEGRSSTGSKFDGPRVNGSD